MLPPRLPLELKAPESLFVPQEICSPEEPPLDSVPLRRASPWQYYTKAYRRELGASVVVACKNPATFELLAVKHENFLTCYEIFVYDGAIFTVSECMAISLTDLNGSAIPPNEIQMATIIHQVLRGLDFLASRNMIHQDITCSTILLSLRGDVKVANPEGCINVGPRSPEMREDIEALGFVMLQLMERGSRRRERLALEHPDKWSPQADKFLQLIHTFLKDSPQKEELVRLIACAQISSHIPFCLEGS
ncbi:kinase-like domain-containing protein [Hyaloscypha finlandica]|nr:kinase-like domain-containing protein [Hyaloscypha finlandica]